MVQRPKSPIAVIVALLAPAVLLALYVVGYFVLAESDSMPVWTLRRYSHPWIARLYYPAAMVEAKVTGQRVALVSSYQPMLLAEP